MPGFEGIQHAVAVFGVQRLENHGRPAGPQRKPSRILSMKYWLFHKDPIIMAFIIPT